MTRPTLRPVSLVLSALALAGAAAPALAGGIDMPVRAEAAAPDPHGLVALKVTIQRRSFDCQPTVYLASARGGYGPQVFLERREGKEWKAVKGSSPYGTQVDAFNRVTFDPVETDGLRIELKLRDNCSGGVLEWRFHEAR